jgi:hypothetical protein
LETIPASAGTHAGGSGGSGGGGSSHPGYMTDKEERDTVASKGVDFVWAFEKHRHLEEHGCSPKIESKEKVHCGYDILSTCEKETRQIEVKSSKGDLQTVELTAPEWDAARKAESGTTFFLYRVRNLDKRGGKEPDIIIIKDPYSNLMGEPTRFKVRLNKLKGKMVIIPLKKPKDEHASS